MVLKTLLTWFILFILNEILEMLNSIVFHFEERKQISKDSSQSLKSKNITLNELYYAQKRRSCTKSKPIHHEVIQVLN